MKYGFVKIIWKYLLAFFMLGGCLFAMDGRDTLILLPGKTVYPLTYNFFHVDSIKPQPLQKYFSDPLYGRLVFVTPPISQDTVTVYYSYNPINAPRHTDLGISRLSSWFPQEADKTENTSARSTVATSGSISRKLQVSSSGQSTLSGGIDLRLSGDVAPGVTLQGIISDNNAPFEEYSSTQSVQEVDKILIQLKSDIFNVTMGDVIINKSWDHWAQIDRKLIGLDASVKQERYEIDAFFGGSQGQFIRQETSGRDGDQGPYRLYGENPQESISIVAGTESVYLDGKKLDKNAYTMYYSEAELYFSQGTILSSTSRIVIEFNYKSEFYPTTNTGFHSSWKLGDHFQVAASYLREKDDENNPGDVNLSGISADSLANMDVNDGFITISTALADTAGAYIKQDENWLYVGSSQGTHTVYFYRENSNGGYIRTYTEDGDMYYIYAPDQESSQYYPRRIVSLPETRDLLAVDLSIEKKGSYKLGVEAAYSVYTGNNYRQENAQQAPALRWDAGLNLSKNISISSDGWYRSQDFTSFSTLNQPEFERSLGYTSRDTLLMYGDLSAEINGDLYHSKTGIQMAEDKNDDQRNRIYTQNTYNKEAVNITVNAYTLADNGLLPYYHTDAALSLPVLKSRSLDIGFLQDYFEPIFGSSSAERTEKFTTAYKSAQGFDLQYVYKRDYDWLEADSSFHEYSRKHDLQTAYKKAFFDKKLDFNLSATYRLDKRESGDEQYFLSNSRLNLRIPKWHLRGSGLMNVNRSSETKREAVFIKVGEGIGYYSLDEYGQYVPDEMGEYIIQYELTNERLDQYISKLGSSLNWDTELGAYKLDVVHSGNTEFRTPQLILYKTLSLQDPDTSCYYGYARFRHEATLSDEKGKNKFSVYLIDKQSQNFQTNYNEQAASRRERRFTYKRKMENGNAEFYYKYESAEQLRLPVGTYSVLTGRHRLGTEIQWNKERKLRLKGGFIYSFISTDFNEEVFATNWLQLRQDVTWYRIAGERFYMSVTLDKVISDYGQSLPYETADGLPVGWSFLGAIRYERQISKFISANAYLQYRKRGEAQDVMTANLEIKAYF